jgi:HEPN domain-containing protein
MCTSTEEAQKLYSAGIRDRTSFQLLVETRRAPNETVGFLAQQACEKFIKSRLVLEGVAFERTHDLEYLAEIASKAKIILPVSVESLRQLNPYAVALRYEGSDVQWVTEADASEMVEAMHTWVKQAIEEAQ